MSFVVLEGIDGCGKSTQARILTQTIINNHRRRVCLTSEPSNGIIGRFIRNKVLPGKHELNEHSIGHLFVSDRIDHVRAEIQPALDRGEVVICDRFMLTTVAYQSTGEDGPSVNRAVLQHADILSPDLTIYLQISPESAMKRLASRKTTTEMYEHQERLERIAERYDLLTQEPKIDGDPQVRDILESHNIVTVDADGSIDEVAWRIYSTAVHGLLWDKA